MEYNNSAFHRLWRPMMAWSYLIICLFDFLGGPIMYAIIMENSEKIAQWTPLTLRGGGLFHMAMLAIVGVTAWGRSQEKLKMMVLGEEVEVRRERETFHTKDTYETEEQVKANRRSKK